MQWQQNGIVIFDEREKVDLDVVHNLLKTSYWAENRPKETIARSIENSLCFSMFKTERQIGFARVVTDFATFSWIADVMIAPQFRGQGLGKFLMRCVTEHPAIAGVKQTLRTRDAHGLYEQYGFTRTEFMMRT
jgi:GNAT superfamily N-acetyltransferase